MTDRPWTKEQIARHYDVDADGSVYSAFHNWRGYGRRQLKAHINAHGYPRVHLTINGQRRHLSVHKLVAMFHLPPRPVGSQIRHLDGNKVNSAAANLAWGSAKDNADDREAHGRTVRGERHPRAKITAEQAATIRDLRARGVRRSDVSRQFGVGLSQITRITKQANWAHVRAAQEQEGQ